VFFTTKGDNLPFYSSGSTVVAFEPVGVNVHTPTFRILKQAEALDSDEPRLVGS
jgi:hypothetical protein